MTNNSSVDEFARTNATVVTNNEFNNLVRVSSALYIVHVIHDNDYHV